MTGDHQPGDFPETRERMEQRLRNHICEAASLAKTIQRGKTPRLERLKSRLQDLKNRVIPRDLKALEI